MSFFITIFNAVLYQPLLNGLILLYEYLPGHDFGIAIIVLTILIKFILYPLGVQGVKSQKILSSLQPEIKEIQEKYKDNKEEQTKRLMELYKEKKVNPFSGCLPLLIQLPILIALYRVFWRGFQLEQTNHLLYSFVPHLSKINTSFLGIIDIGKGLIGTIKINGAEQMNFYWPALPLIILAGILQFIQIKMISSKTKNNKNNKKQKPGFSAQIQKQMQYFMPAFTIIILFRLPSAIGLYWIVITLFTIAQQYFIFKQET